jgi:aryl-alcohol dehydrogenase-like predicted oxidoreductase
MKLMIRRFFKFEELGTDFKLMLTPEYSVQPVDLNVEHMVRRYYDHPNAMRYQGKFCLSTYGMSGEAYNAPLTKLKAEGKIKHFGASVETVDQALMCLEVEGCASLQIIFNLFRQKPIEAFLPKARDRGIGIIVRLPLASGLLAGKFTASTHFVDTDHRAFNRDGQSFNVGETFAGLPFEKGVELANGLKPFVPPGMTMGEMSLRWILDYPEVSVIIPGASSPLQARQNTRASELPPLTPALHRQLAEYYQQRVYSQIRGPY